MNEWMKMYVFINYFLYVSMASIKFAERIFHKTSVVVVVVWQKLESVPEKKDNNDNSSLWRRSKSQTQAFPSDEFNDQSDSIFERKEICVINHQAIISYQSPPERLRKTHTHTRWIESKQAIIKKLADPMRAEGKINKFSLLKENWMKNFLYLNNFCFFLLSHRHTHRHTQREDKVC